MTTPKPAPPPGEWRHRVVRGTEGRKHVPEAVNARIQEQLREDKDTDDEHRSN